LSLGFVLVLLICSRVINILKWK